MNSGPACPLCGGAAPNFVEVRYKLSTSMVWTVVNLPGTALAHTLNGLTPGATYQYRLRNRYIVAGVSKYSPYIFSSSGLDS